ncbi:MAG TPA: (2Fe-2S)-binding protein [Solirubrobacteraceae bacterium]|nr:(2Fe-2S)-binding protein [Solirubrobacteraceae bacterium]
MTRISLEVNETVHELDVAPRLLLADLLRDRLGLTGTKIGCAMGACGACTVLLDGAPVRGCLMFAVQANGRSVRTVEDLAEDDGALHPLQRALHEHHGLQCGYCTPGMLMAVLPLVESGQPLEPDAVREAISGNLCRCTGYDTIVDAIVEASRP